MSANLSLRAGPEALRLIRERGLRAEDVDVVPGASGGPKSLVLSGLDRVVFGEFFRARSRPLHLIGSSIGSWRLACLGLADPVAALERFAEAYIAQSYPPRPSPERVSQTSQEFLDTILGPEGDASILGHPWVRLHVLTNRCRGLSALEPRHLQTLGLALGALGNVVSRRTLGLHLERVVFHSAGDTTPFTRLDAHRSVHVPLTRANLRPAILASGSIPLVMSGVRIPEAPAGVYRDGGLLDYHLDLDFGAGQGWVLYPHFYPYVVPGWFDKSLRWRRAGPTNFRRVLLLSPSPEFVARLPHGRIPDRSDFERLSDAERMRAWRQVVAESERLGEEFHEGLATGRLVDRIQPL
ncbi:patatin-like phospholipase family protein [Cystobacter fuscus]|uniref:patatin-like phospholipase family protein n=1 Tax=Cystobacter fuscus TaxID=43 RepID=UPI002B2ED10E|nr:patatin-like phospholipase family protein [Cystobacter fuscus]